jgi:Ca2+-binding EF-hand superfamily protein
VEPGTNGFMSGYFNSSTKGSKRDLSYHDQKRESYVYVGVNEAKDLIACDGKTSDPYCIITLPTANPSQNLTHKTKVLKKTLTPKWSEHVHSYGVVKAQVTPESDPEIIIDVYDWNQIQKHKFMGRVVLPLSKLIPYADKEHVDWYPLQGRKDKKKPDKVSGSIQLAIQFFDPTIPEEEMAQIKERMKLAKSKVNSLWIEFNEKKDKTSGEVSTPAQLIDLLEQCGVLIAVMDKWSAKMADLDHRTHQQFIKDTEFRKHLGEIWFRALDTDGSGKLSWKELIFGMNMLLEGSSEDMIRMRFRSQDLDHSGTMTHDEAMKIGELTAILFKLGFSIGLELQKAEMKRAGLTEHDFQGIVDAIGKMWTKFGIPKLEADLLFKYCDKNQDGQITEEEYVAFSMNPTEKAKMEAELAELMKPALANLQVDLQREMEKLISRIIARSR